jgi:uncharacterized protein (DUF983 family)
MYITPTPIEAALTCACPRCGKGRLFSKRFSLECAERCSACGLALAKNDSGDGPAVFMIFILGFLLVPFALLFDAIVSPPLWVHAVLWTVVALGICFFTLQPIKAYVVALQFKHRPQDWEN